MEVTAVLITYNSSANIEESIQSLEEALNHLESEILVVDNASADDTATKAGKTISRGHVIVNSNNLGYAKAANVGLRHAQGRLTLIMNDDAQLQPGAIDRMIEVLDSDERTALVGPRIVDSKGATTHSARLHYPGAGEEWRRALDLLTRRRTLKAYPADARPMLVHWLIAACVIGESSLLRRVGGFNEAFFLYGEDIDLGRRLRELGYRSETVPEAVCVHIGEASTSQVFSTEARMRRQVAGRSVYYRLWLPRWGRTLVYLRRAFGIRMQPDRLRIFLPLAIWDGPSLHHQRFPTPLLHASEENESPSL